MISKRTLLILTMVCALFMATSAQATVYTFTKIAQTSGGPFNTVGNPTINDHGDLSFWAGSAGVFYGNALGSTLGDYTHITGVNSGTWTYIDTMPVINNNRQVAFTVGFDAPNYYGGIYVGDGSETQQSDYTEISNFSSTGISNVGGLIRINNNGLVAFSSTGTNPGVYTSNGTTLTKVFGTGRPIYSSKDPGLNDLGQVSVWGNRTSSTQIDGVFVGNGTEITENDYATIADETPGVLERFSQLGPSAINNHGQVAFKAEVAGQYYTYDASILVGSNGDSQLSDYRVVVTEGLGPIDNLGHYSFNEAGTVAFNGFNYTSGSPVIGIYTGNDPVTDKVIEVGDPMFGSTVQGLNLTSNALNESGQIALTIWLTNGNHVIARVDPVAGSSPLHPLMPGGGTPGQFDFTFTAGDQGIGTDTLMFIDPEVALGYDYQVNGGPNFASVLPPTGVGNDLYDLYLWNGSGFVLSGSLTGGVEFDFAGAGVDRFRILGIEEAAALDPNDPLAFITGLTFAGEGVVDMTMTPIPTPEPMTAAVLLLGLAAIRTRRTMGSERS